VLYAKPRTNTAAVWGHPLQRDNNRHRTTI
jgi:hypothetical protein